MLTLALFLFVPLAHAASLPSPDAPLQTLPTLRRHPPVQANTESPIGPELSASQLAFRMQRARELDGLFEELSWAIPAEVNAAVGTAWMGPFVRTRLPPRLHRALATGLAREQDVSAIVRRRLPSGPVLVTWLDDVTAAPMTLASLPGEVVDSPVGPIVVDGTNEPFLVQATIGAALVEPDGTVLHRSYRTYDAVMRGEHALDVTALDLARGVAQQVASAWRD